MPQDPFAQFVAQEQDDPFAAFAVEEKPAKELAKPKPFKSESGFRGIEAIGDAVRGIPDIARNLFNGNAGATLSGFGEGAKAGVRDFDAALAEEVEGGKDLAKMTAEMVKHPIDTATGLAGGFAEAGRAIPDIVRNTSPWSASSTPESRRASLGGFVRGTSEGLTGVDADAAAANPLRAIGSVLTMVGTGGVGKRVMGVAKPHMARGLAKLRGPDGPLIEQAGDTLARIQKRPFTPPTADGPVSSRIAYRMPDPKGPTPIVGNLTKVKGPTVESAMADALADVRKPTQASHVELPVANAQPPVSYPRVPRKPAQKAPEAPRTPQAAPVAEALPDRPTALPEAPEALPESWQRLVDGEGPPDLDLPDTDLPMWSREAPGSTPIGNQRAAVGAEKAARRLGNGLTPDDVRNMAGGPKRQPLEATNALLDKAYQYALDNPKMAVGAGVGLGAAALADDEDKPMAAMLPFAMGAGISRPMKTIGATTRRTSSHIARPYTRGAGRPTVAKPSVAELRQKSPVASANDLMRAEQEASGIKPAQFGPTKASRNDAGTTKYAGAERRATSRVSNPTEDATYADIRRRQGEGQMTGSAELREMGRNKSQIDARTVERRKGLAEREGLTGERGEISPKLMRDIGLGTAGAATGAALANDDSKVAGGALGAIGGLAAANPFRAARTLQQIRVAGMLSGAALPKSIAGNIGAVATSAIENHSLRPIKEALRIPTNVKNAVHGWRNNANPAHVAGMGRINLPARAMGALDHMTTNLLQRGGETLPGAQRLLLTNPNTLGAGNFGNAMRGAAGKAAFPFQSTPFNGLAEGLKSVDGLLGTGSMKQTPHSGTMKALTAGSIGAGAAAGAATDDPRLLALAAALFGPRGVPFAMGTAATAGPRIAAKIGVRLPEGGLEDFADPETITRPITDPAILRFIEWLQGQQQP